MLVNQRARHTHTLTKHDQGNAPKPLNTNTRGSWMQDAGWAGTQQGPRVPSLSHRDADKHKPVGQPKEGGGLFPPLREEVESRQSTNDSRSTKRETKCKSNIHPMPPIHRHTREAQSYTLSESEPSNALGVREALTARSQMI